MINANVASNAFTGTVDFAHGVSSNQPWYSTQNNQADHNSIHKTKEQTTLCGTALFMSPKSINGVIS